MYQSLSRLSKYLILPLASYQAIAVNLFEKIIITSCLKNLIKNYGNKYSSYVRESLFLGLQTWRSTILRPEIKNATFAPFHHE